MIRVYHLFDKGWPDRFPNPHGTRLRDTEQRFHLPLPCNLFFFFFWRINSASDFHFYCQKKTRLKSFGHSEKERKLTDIYGRWKDPPDKVVYFSMESLYRTIDYNYNFETCVLLKNPKVNTLVGKDVKRVFILPV